MPSANRQPDVETKCYTMAELYELRRVIIKRSRSMPPGPTRNEHRQLARSMRSLCKDKAWLAIHTVSNPKAGERVSREGSRDMGTIVEVAREIKVVWDSGRTSYFRNLPANVILDCTA
jgi:hypothetical protein